MSDEETVTADELRAMSTPIIREKVSAWKRKWLVLVVKACKEAARKGDTVCTRYMSVPDGLMGCHFDDLRAYIAARIHGARISGTGQEVTVSWGIPRGPTFTIAPPPQDSDAPANLPIPK